MLKVWGRANGSNVVKVMWCIGELGLPHERIDWAGRFGGNDDPAYRKLNPNGRIPTIVEDDGFTLWESGAIIRYLCAKHSSDVLCPKNLRARANAEKWMDWSSLNLQPFNAPLSAQLFMLPAEQRDPAIVARIVRDTAPKLDILDQHLSEQAYLCGDQLSMADIPAGSLMHRWMKYAPNRPTHRNVEAWYQRLAERPAFQEHVMSVTPGR